VVLTQPASQHYTLLAKNSDSNYIPVPPPNNCYYETTTGMEAYDTPFPITWLQGDETYQVGPWFELPNDMIYSGEYFISELGVMSDVRLHSFDDLRLIFATALGLAN
jgi:hypothetical protein